MPEPYWRDKLDAHLRARLAIADQATELEVVNVLVQVRGDIEPLTALGLVIGSQAGNVLIGRVPLGRIPAIAQVPDVAFVELERALPYDAPPSPD